MALAGINFERYAPWSSSAATSHALVACYQEVFAGPPWNEWMRCSLCGKYWGKDAASILYRADFIHCGARVVRYWPTTQVLADLQNEITPQASCWIATSTEAAVLGFCWGYEASVEALERKLGLPLAEPFSRIAPKERFVAYQDDLGVDESLRGRGIAKKLFTLRHGDFRERGLAYGIVRTREYPEPSVTFFWFTQKLGYRVLARYPEGDGRAVLYKDLRELDSVLA